MPKIKYIGGEGAPENDTLFGFKVGKFGDAIDVEPDHPQWPIISSHPWFEVQRDETAAGTPPPPVASLPVPPEPPMDQQTIDALSEESIRLAEATLKANEGDENAFDVDTSATAPLPVDVQPAAVVPPPPEPIVEQPAPPTTRRRRTATPPEGTA